MGSIKTKDGFSLYAYHAEVDSKGFAWYTQYDTGWLVRLDPRTGEQTIVKSDQVPATRGMDIDADDNIWYTNWGGHGLVKYDPRTGQSKHYRYPTEYAMPYSVFIDKKRGYVWSGDYSGNNLTRLDPRTGEFVEFPLPNPHSYPRFISLDDDGRVWFAEWWNGRAGVLDPGYAPISATARQ
ncbi:MAG: hypothetical protein IPJ97_13275 [Proteobacteria bacterium]|nr:hypothetical protein [Pseudomonadota bacterium]